MSKRDFDACDYCCKWVAKHKGTEPAEVMADYPKMMCKVLRHKFGLSKSAAKVFVRTACEGNWLKLHETDVEKHVGSDVYADMILAEVRYCSDRWSYDRVLRVQWLYMRLVWACRKDEEMEDLWPLPQEAERWGCFCTEIGSFGRWMTVHVMECPECGRTYEHVNGDYERCPHCGTRFRARKD